MMKQGERDGSMKCGQETGGGKCRSASLNEKGHAAYSVNQ